MKRAAARLLGVWHRFRSWLTRWSFSGAIRLPWPQARFPPMPRRRPTRLRLEPFEERLHPNDPLGLLSVPLLGASAELLRPDLMGLWRPTSPPRMVASIVSGSRDDVLD